jgi:hypothetical protein
MDCKQGEEVPSQPTGVRIDGSKLLTIHTDLVRLTDNWPVEKLERVNTILAKVSLVLGAHCAVKEWIAI